MFVVSNSRKNKIERKTYLNFDNPQDYSEHSKKNIIHMKTVYIKRTNYMFSFPARKLKQQKVSLWDVSLRLPSKWSACQVEK